MLFFHGLYLLKGFPDRGKNLWEIVFINTVQSSFKRSFFRLSRIKDHFHQLVIINRDVLSFSDVISALTDDVSVYFIDSAMV